MPRKTFIVGVPAPQAFDRLGKGNEAFGL